MAFTNKLKRQVDLPVWEWCRFAQVATSATSAMCATDDGTGRYMYYLSGTFWRYDTWTDDWQQLATPPTAAVTAVALKYTAFGGHRGNVIGATASSVVVAGLALGKFNGLKIRILAGTGAGQERTITDSAEPVIKDHGIVTAATALVLTDSTKKWSINQFIGYRVRVVFNTGQSQIRKVLYNDATNLYVSDTNFQQLDSWNNTGFSATAPYAVPVATAGSQAHYYIESQTLTLDTSWTVQPDLTSSYVILSGGVWMLSANAAAPWSSMQYYDIASDTWFTKTPTGGLLLAALGTDFAIERTGEIGGTFLSGTATAGGARILTDSGKAMTPDQYCNFQIRITGGTGVGQRKRIVGNTATTFYVETNWTTNPSTDSTYAIFGDTDKMYLSGNGGASVLKYSVENDIWFQGPNFDIGQARQISIQYPGQEAFTMSTGVRNTGGITAVASAPTVGGTGYVVGDILTISTGGTVGKVRVESVLAGVVQTVSLFSAGLTYTTGTGKATTGGTGSGCTVNITAIGTVGRITTVTNHNLINNDAITVAGCSESAWNGAYTVLATDSLTTFDILITATANAAATTAQGTTTLVDAAMNWTVNEHVGKLVVITVAGVSPTTQVRRITANTSNTLTLQLAITTAVNGTSRYVIQEAWALGRDMQYKVPAMSNMGWATGGSTTTLVDSGKSWNDNQWAGYRIRIVCGIGIGNEFAITSNTATTLTYGSQSFTPDATTKYIIMDTFGILTTASTTVLTDTTKVWTVNMWAGKRVRITSSSGQCQEGTVLSNTANALTLVAALGTAPDTTSTYCILGVPARGAGITIVWAFGGPTAMKGKYLYSPRGGGSNIFDRYNITTGVWDVTLLVTPQTELMTTGTMYSYDGVNTIYFTNASATISRVYALNVSTGEASGAGLAPYVHSTAVLGNRMEIVETEDGLQYLYMMRHSGNEMWRILLWW